MRPGVDVDAGLGARRGPGAGGRLDDRGVAEERGGLRGLGELGGELPEHQVLAALADQAEGRDVPERRRAAVAEDHLVARRAARTARRRPRGPGRRGSSPGPGGGRCRAGRCRWRRAPARASTRTLEGPAPKRPSAGWSGGGDGDRLGHGDCLPRGVSRAGDLTSLSAGAPLSWHPRPTGHGRGHLMSMRIVAVAFAHPDTQRLVAEVQAEYVVLYGGPDATPLDTGVFDPPHGAFFVGYVDGEPVAMGGWRLRSGRAPARADHARAEVKRMYVAPAARRRGLARAVLAHLEETAARGRGRGDGPGDGHGAARGDRDVRARPATSGSRASATTRGRRSRGATASGSEPDSRSCSAEATARALAAVVHGARGW